MKRLALALLPGFAFGCLSLGADCTDRGGFSVIVRADLACPTLDEVADEERVEEVHDFVSRNWVLPTRSVCWYRVTGPELANAPCSTTRSAIVADAYALRPDMFTTGPFVDCEEQLSGHTVAPREACEETSDFVGRDELPGIMSCLYDVTARHDCYPDDDGAWPTPRR